MKTKFDFPAEIDEAEPIKNTPKNEHLKGGKRLSDVNAKELASLNGNVFELRTEVENLSGPIRERKPTTSEEIQNLAIELGAILLYSFLSQTESECEEAEQRMGKADGTIPIPDTVFYVLIIIVVILSSFFMCMAVANTEILHSGLIRKAVICYILVAILEIGMALIVQKFLDRGR